MQSVPNRFKEPSTAARMLAAVLSSWRICGSPSPWEVLLDAWLAMAPNELAERHRDAR